MHASSDVESGAYRRHQPEKTLQYQVVQEHLETFLAYADSRGGGPLPQDVRDTFRRFPKCRMLQNGFACQGTR